MLESSQFVLLTCGVFAPRSRASGVGWRRSVEAASYHHRHEKLELRHATVARTTHVVVRWTMTLALEAAQCASSACRRIWRLRW